MSQLCKHCATPYAGSSGVDGFCCSGCRQVYLLIQGEGLEDYYRFQDRVAQPLKDRALADFDLAELRRVQSEVEERAEAGQATFEIEGMSCMGCAWLVERLAGNQSGLVEAEASLTRRWMTLKWRSGEFDLSALGAELYRFGYRMNSKPKDPHGGSRFSPLAVRAWLSCVFTGNALLLVAFDLFVLPAGHDGIFINLLSLICLCFTLLLGVAPFFLSAYRAFQIRRWHSDWWAVGMVATCASYVAKEVFISQWDLSFGVFLVSLLVSVLIGVRWLGLR